MTTITIKSRKLGRSVTFAKRGQYIYVDKYEGGFCDKQIFDADGNAYTARDETDLKEVAGKYLLNLQLA